jgi:hypothetical protein
MGFKVDSGFDIFLGGTHDSNWRKKFLELINDVNPKIKCYDPSVEKWTYENVILENLVKQNTKYHVYVLTPNMVGTYSVAEMIDSSHEDGVETYFYIMEEDINSDGKSVYWSPRLLNSIYAINNMMIRHGAHKASSLEELVTKITNDYQKTLDEQ